MKNDVVIDGKGYNFGTKREKIGGVWYEIPDNEYPLEFIVAKSEMMIMLKNHCAIPDIHRKIVAKTGEHIAKMIVEFYGGWTPEVARLCDQKNTRTIIFIAEKPESESDQPEIPFEETENYRIWELGNEYIEMCYRNNGKMDLYKFYQVLEGHAGDITSLLVSAIEADSYERTVYDSDKVNEYALPKTDEAVAQAHYDSLRKRNNPNAIIPEPAKKIEPSLKDFAKSLEPKEAEKVLEVITEKAIQISDNPDVAVRKVVYKEKEIVPEPPKVVPISEGKKSYKKK